jgi:hypothetical protein
MYSGFRKASLSLTPLIRYYVQLSDQFYPPGILKKTKMKSAVKKVIEDLVVYYNSRKPTGGQQEAFDAMGKTDFFILTSKILQWNKMVDMKTYMGDNPNELEIKNEVLYKKYVQLFDLYKPLSKIYKLEKKGVVFAPDISDEEKNEILIYVNQNVVIPLFVHKTPDSIKRR